MASCALTASKANNACTTTFAVRRLSLDRTHRSTYSCVLDIAVRLTSTSHTVLLIQGRQYQQRDWCRLQYATGLSATLCVSMATSAQDNHCNQDYEHAMRSAVLQKMMVTWYNVQQFSKDSSKDACLVVGWPTEHHGDIGLVLGDGFTLGVHKGGG